MKTSWIVILIVTVIGLAVIWFLYNYDLVTESHWEGPTARVWSDPYLAAHRWAIRRGYATRDFTVVEEIAGLDPHSVAIMPARRNLVTADARQAVVGFVEGGGHLIVESEGVDNPDVLLDAFGVTRAELSEAAASSNEWGWWLQSPTKSNSGDDAALLRVKLPDYEDPAVVYIGGNESLAAEQALFVASSGKDQRLIHLAHGHGRVTAINDIRFIGNLQIGRNDNAEFFDRLLRQTPAVKTVAFFRPLRVSLGSWLASHALLPLIALAALIVFGLWRRVPRFGPLAPDPLPARRRLIDHLAASGRFLWASGNRGALALATARSVGHAVQTQFPHYPLMTPIERIGFLQQRFGVGASAATQIVAAQPLNHAAALIALTRAAASIHAQLAHHGARRSSPSATAEKTP